MIHYSKSETDTTHTSMNNNNNTTIPSTTVSQADVDRFIKYIGVFRLYRAQDIQELTEAINNNTKNNSEKLVPYMYQMRRPRLGNLGPIVAEGSLEMVSALCVRIACKTMAEECRQRCHVCQMSIDLLNDKSSVLVDIIKGDSKTELYPIKPLYACSFTCGLKSNTIGGNVPNPEDVDYINYVNLHLQEMRKDPVAYGTIFLNAKELNEYVNRYKTKSTTSVPTDNNNNDVVIKEVGDMNTNNNNNNNNTKKQKPNPSAPPIPAVENDLKIYPAEECVVCLINIPDTLVLPCGHCVVCKECSDQLKSTPKKFTCIVCSQHITHVLD